MRVFTLDGNLDEKATFVPVTDEERRRLAVKGKALGRRALQQITTIVTPDTILRWHRRLIAEKWDYSQRKQ